MAHVLIPYLITFMPLIVTSLGWIGAHRKRHSEPLHPLDLGLLAFVTALALVAAASFVYFELRPEHLAPWESTEVILFGWFLILGPASVFVSFLTLRREPGWLFWVLEVASVWLTGLGLLAAMAF